MDLPLFFGVLWRFRWLVFLGVFVAAALAFLSVFRIDTENGFAVEYRQSEQWVSVATVLVTEGDFPLGRAALQQDVPPAELRRAREVHACSSRRRRGSSSSRTSTPSSSPATRCAG